VPSLQRGAVAVPCGCHFREINFGILYGFPQVDENICDGEDLAGMCRVFNDEMHRTLYWSLIVIIIIIIIIIIIFIKSRIGEYRA